MDYSNVISKKFPYSKQQRCIMHVIKNILAKVRVKDKSEVIKDFREVYIANDKEKSKENFEKFSEKWKKTYAGLINSIEKTYENIITFYDFPKAIWRQIYTSNWIERMNKEVKKIFRPKNSLPNIKSAEKLIYLAVVTYCKRWEERRLKGFIECKDELDILLEKSKKCREAKYS